MGGGGAHLRGVTGGVGRKYWWELVGGVAGMGQNCWRIANENYLNALLEGRTEWELTAAASKTVARKNITFSMQLFYMDFYLQLIE